MFAILIADNDEVILESIASICKDEGYKVLKANSYDEAIRVLKMQRVNLILLDSKLSNIDDIQILKDIKAINQDIPVIIFLEQSNIEFAVRATRSGAYDILEKPLSPERVLLVIKRVFEGQT